MRETENLAVEIAEDEIIISMPQTGQRIVYRKDPVAPMLVATDPFRDDPDASRTAFLVLAWKAAHATARSMGWLKS